MKPITVIIPTYNREKLLKKAIDSVLVQNYSHFELIVVDDGSDDDTGALVAGYSNVRYIRQENRGAAAARNRGLEMARHDLIAFLDSDDWFDPAKLEVQSRAMAEKPEYLISHTDEIWYRRGILLNQKKKHRKPDGHIFADCLPLCAVSMSTVMARRALFDEVGLFDERLPCCEDYDFWLRASVRFPFLKIDKPLTLKDGGRPDEVSFQYRTGMDRFRVQAILKLLEETDLSPEQERMARTELTRKCVIYGNGCIKHGRPDEGRFFLELAETHGV